MAAQQLDHLDHTILNILLKDARTPYLEIARMCQVSGATVHLRIQKLEKLGIIEGSRLILNYKKLGFGVSAFLGLYLEKCGKFEEILEDLQSIPDVIECHYTTGEYGIRITCANSRSTGFRKSHTCAAPKPSFHCRKISIASQICKLLSGRIRCQLRQKCFSPTKYIAFRGTVAYFFKLTFDLADR